MKRTLLGCFLIVSCGLLLGAVRPGGIQPLESQPFEGGIRPITPGNWVTAMVAISSDPAYLSPDSLKANGGPYDYIVNTDNHPDEFLGGIMRMQAPLAQVISSVVDYATLDGSSYWSGTLTDVVVVHLPLNNLPGFYNAGTEVTSAEYTIFWRAAGYTLVAGDTLFVVGGNLSDMPVWETGNYGCSRNLMDVGNSIQWPLRGGSTDPINWSLSGLNAVSSLDYSDHPYLVNHTSAGMNDSSVFNVTPWAQSISSGSYNSGLWHLGARSIESGTTQWRSGSCTSTDVLQNRPRMIIEYRYRALKQASRSSTASYPLGGHTWSSAIAHDERYLTLGGDVGGTWGSTDGGISWGHLNNGVVNDQDQPVHYTRDLLSVKNSYFEGFIMSNDSGIWKMQTPFNYESQWTPMMDVTDNNYLSYTHYSWDDYLEVIGFGSIEWDGNNLLAATSGRNRYNSGMYDLAYPWNVADGDSLTGDFNAASWVDGDWSDNSFGKCGVWIYDYTRPEHGWHPVEDGYDSYRQEWGRYKDVDVAVIGPDTLYVVATSAGPKLLTVTSSGKTWNDINQYDWLDVSSGVIDGPLFTTESTSTAKYHYNGPEGVSSIGDGHITIVEEIQASTPVTGTVTVGGNGYTYTSWTGSTFDISGTLLTNIAKGASVTQNISTQATWNVMITGRGDIYCIVANEDQEWVGDSGLYKLHYGDTAWRWVGDGTKLIPVEGGQNITKPDWLSVADLGNGSWVECPLYPEHDLGSHPTIQFGQNFVRLSGVAGSGTDPDTLYMGGNHSTNTFRVLSAYGSTGGSISTWVPIIWRDYTYDPVRDMPFPDMESYAGLSSATANFLIHKIAVDPENSNNIFATPSDKGYLSSDGGVSWSENISIDHPLDPDFFKSVGIDEICVTGIAVLSDGRLLSARADMYAGISYDSSWEYSARFSPLGEDNKEDCTNENTDNALWSSESGDVIVIQGWDGINPTEDYIIFNSGDIHQNLNPCKIFLIHDDNGDGDFFDLGEWDNITKGLTDANKYNYPGNQTTDGVNRIWIPYEFHNLVICDFSTTAIRHGVLEFNLSGAWSYNEIGQSRIDSLGIYPKKVQYDSDENRLWMIAGFAGAGGGVYMMDLDEIVGTWVAVMGEGAEGPYASYEILGAFESIALAKNNDVIYFGSTGRSGKAGGIWRITNPDAQTDGFIIEKVLNDTGKPYAPTVTGSRFYNSRTESGNAAPSALSSRGLMCNDILINPYNNDQIWFVNESNYNRMTSLRGLYALDTSTNEVTKIMENDPRGVFAGTRSGIALIYTEFTDPPRLIWGTQCIGVSWIEYNGIFPTEWEQ